MQSLKTAPKDGTVIMLIAGYAQAPIEAQFINGKWRVAATQEPITIRSDAVWSPRAKRAYGMDAHTGKYIGRS